MMRTWPVAALSFVIAIPTMSMFASRAVAQSDSLQSAPGVYSLPPLPTPRTPFRMVINLHKQRAYVFRDGVRVGTSRISSGKRGYRTPTGTFTVLEKQKVHHSNKYDNASMPYMQRLSWYGLALHAGHVPGYPASHGCVRMPLSFARWLYHEPTMGMTVVITNHSRPASTTVAASTSAEPPTDVGDDATTASQ